MTANVHKLKVKDSSVNVPAVFNQTQYCTFPIKYNLFFNIVSKVNVGRYDHHRLCKLHYHIKFTNFVYAKLCSLFFSK